MYEEERDALRRKVGAQGMRVENLLGDIGAVKETLEFIEATKRFKF
jgi:hypothetical protein